MKRNDGSERVKVGYKQCWLYEREREKYMFLCYIFFAYLTGNQFGSKWDPYRYQYDPKNLIGFV